MKHGFLIFFLSVTICFACLGQSTNDLNIKQYHNRIDKLNDIKSIEKLVASIDKEYIDFQINSTLTFVNKDFQRICDSLKIKPYTKADFDKNGYTDLLVVGQGYSPLIICVLDLGKNSFLIKDISNDKNQECAFPKVISNKNQTLIDYYYIKERDWRKYDTIIKVESKKLICKFNDFIEFNDSSNDYHIHKIEYKTTMCFGTCPIFELTINSDRTANYNAISFNEPDGKFTGIIELEKFIELVDLVNYIDFPNLNNSYSINWTDNQSCSLIITYNNGKVKTIDDYGLIGTYGLAKVYDFLFKLRHNQKWK
jgi:hypothetical protein